MLSDVAGGALLFSNLKLLISSIAINKNNLFGHAAYDSSAYDSATGYLNPFQSIVGHAKSYINCGYANPNDSRYFCLFVIDFPKLSSIDVATF